MNFELKGNLAAFLCNECTESLSRVVVRFYDAQPYDNLTHLVVANEKETLQVLSDEAVEAKKKRLLGETKTDENGNFSIRFSDKIYKGQAIEIDVFCKEVPGQKNKSKKIKPVQFTVTTILPKWRETNNGLVALWRYVLPNRFWCYILSLFDVWVICGRVINCKNQGQAYAGVDVTVMDADWLQDDNLGTTTTDASGRFRLYYSSKDFKQTFLSPVINVETPFPPYNSGPDVYFKVVSGGGTVLLEETRADGKKSGRSNIGNCYCISLCITDEIDDDDDAVIESEWTGIGTAFLIPDGVSLHDFDAVGHAGAQKFALTRNIRLTGQAPIEKNNHPVEYRFLISETAGINGDPALPASSFTQVVGKDPDLFSSVRVGFYRSFTPVYTRVEIFAEESDLDADGWLDINNSIQRTFADEPSLDPAMITNPAYDWKWIDDDGLMGLKTASLTKAPNVPEGSISAGQSVPAANLIPQERIAIRFEIREVIDKAADIYSYLPSSGQTLNALVINNNSHIDKLIMDGHQTTPCAPLGGDVKAIYTVYHPYLDSVYLRIKKNGASTVTLNDGIVPIVNNTNNALVEAVNPGFTINPSYPLSKCTYIVSLHTLLRLHTGDGQLSWRREDTSFYYE